jgi:hypothetical protein
MFWRCQTLSALAIGNLTLHEEVRTIRDIGLFCIDIFGVIIAIFVGVHLLYKELDCCAGLAPRGPRGPHGILIDLDEHHLGMTSTPVFRSNSGGTSLSS